MYRFKKSIWLPLLALILLASCHGAETSGINPTAIVKTAEVVAWTEVARARQSAATQTPLPPTQTPLLPTETLMEWDPTLTPGPWGYIDAPPNADQQTYRDPEGWYIVNFPKEFESTDIPNRFISSSGEIFETGYLSELSYLSNMINICTWLTNLMLDPQKSSMSTAHDMCVASSTEQYGYQVRYTVRMNPVAEPEHRFIYIKTSGYLTYSGFLGDRVDFSWRKPLSEVTPLPVTSSPAKDLPWGTPDLLYLDVSISEFALPSSMEPTRHDGLFVLLPTPDRPTTQAGVTPTPRKVNLKQIGYELKSDERGYSSLYRDGRILFENATRVSDIYTFQTDSGPLTAFIVEIELGNKNFVIQNDAVYDFGGYAIYNSAPILYQGNLLWARTYNERIEIKKSNGDILFKFVTPWIANKPPHFRDWAGHWVLQSGDFLIIDGEIMNAKLGFGEIFNWTLLKGKPLYFFRKGPNVGISYDEKFLPLQYQDVAHGLCCGPAQNNPSVGEDSLSFFGKRDGLWYYVVVEFD